MTTNQICAAALVADSDAPAGLNKRDLGKKHDSRIYGAVAKTAAGSCAADEGISLFFFSRSVP